MSAGNPPIRNFRIAFSQIQVIFADNRFILYHYPVVPPLDARPHAARMRGTGTQQQQATTRAPHDYESRLLSAPQMAAFTLRLPPGCSRMEDGACKR